MQGISREMVSLLPLLEHSSGKNDGNVDWLQIKARLEGHAYPYKMEGLCRDGVSEKWSDLCLGEIILGAGHRITSEGQG